MTINSHSTNADQMRRQSRLQSILGIAALCGTAALASTTWAQTRPQSQPDGTLPSWVESVQVNRPVTGGIGSVTLEGTWGDGCAPDAISHTLIGGQVTLEVTQPGLNVACFAAETSWRLTEEFGPGTREQFSIFGNLVAVNPADRSERQHLRGPDLLAEISPPPRAEFQGLGNQPGNDAYQTYAYDVSADGRVVSGMLRLAPNATGFITSQGLAWTPETGAIPIGLLPGGIPGYSQGKAISGDGHTIAGTSTTGDEHGLPRSFSWTLGTGMKTIPHASATGDSRAPVESSATGVSQNGGVIVGYERPLTPGVAVYPQPSIAYRWSAETGSVDLGHLPNLAGGEFGIPAVGITSASTDVSADGNVVVGTSRALYEICFVCDFAYEPQYAEPFRWTKETGMVGLGHLGAPDAPSLASVLTNVTEANAVSADGNTVVGNSTVVVDTALFPATTTRAYRWTEETGIQDLGGFSDHSNPDNFAYSAVDTNEDGSIIVGNAKGPLSQTDANGEEIFVSGEIGFIWDAQRGVQPIEKVLKLDYGIDLEGWFLSEIAAISADGSTIVGNGTNPAGESEAWRIVLGHSYVAGDTDFNGIVDKRDLMVVGKNLGKGNRNEPRYWAHGDFDGDGTVSASDFAAAKANFVPEPSSLSILLLATGLLVVQYRRKRPS